MTTQHCPRPHVSFAVNKTGTLFHRDAAGNPLIISGEGFGRLKFYVPFNWKVVFNMTQLPSSKKHRTSRNYLSCFCVEAMQAIVCGNKLPGSAKQANKDFATKMVQKARPAFSVSKRSISGLRAFSTAEERKKVLPSGTLTTSPKPIVNHWNQPCMAISYASFPLGSEVASPGCHCWYSYSVVPTLLRSLESKLHVIISYVNKVIHMTQPLQ